MEELFLLEYYLGMDYEVARRLPIQYRKWKIQRLQQEITKQTAGDQGDSNVVMTKAPHDNSPLQQQMMGVLPGTPMSRRR